MPSPLKLSRIATRKARRDSRQQTMFGLFDDKLPENATVYPDPDVPNESYLHLSVRDALVAQIRRDQETLKLSPFFQDPGSEFYEARIKQYQDYLKDTDHSLSGKSTLVDEFEGGTSPESS